MTKRQDLNLQRRSRPEQSDQRQPNQAANISHQPRAPPNSTALTSRIEFPTMTSLYEQLRIRFYIHQNFPGDHFGVSKIKVKQACLNKLQYFIVRSIGAFAVLEYHHSDTDAFAPIQYIIRSESVRFP